MEDKKCSKCKLIKELPLFPKDKKGILGRHSQCKACAKEARLSKGEGAHAARQKTWRENNKEKYREYARVWSYKKIGISITEEEYKAMIVAQDNKCLLCGNSGGISGKEDRALCLDHDHKTGKVRGLLCNACNIGLGKFKDDISVLAKAITYLSQKNG